MIKKWHNRLLLAGIGSVALFTAFAGGSAYNEFQRYQSDHVHERADAGKAALYELKAQQDVAEWAYSALWISIFGVVLTGAGIVYVALTLNESRKATAAAFEAAKATDRAASISEAVGQAQVRAYLSVGEGNLIAGDFEREGKTVWGCRIDCPIKNYGQSPASAIRIEVLVQWLIGETYGEASLKSGLPPIPANTEESHSFLVPVSEWGKIGARIDQLEATIIVLAWDVFDKHIETITCLFYERPPLGNSALGAPMKRIACGTGIKRPNK